MIYQKRLNLRSRPRLRLIQGLTTALISLFFSIVASGKNPVYKVIFNEDCLSAYQYVLDADFTQCSKAVARAKSQNPDNLAPVYLEALSGFVQAQLMDHREFSDSFLNSLASHIDVIEGLEDYDPWKSFLLGELYLQKSITCVLEGYYVKAAFSFKQSYKTLTDGVQQHPNFLPLKKTLLLEKAVIGAIPGQYLKLAAIIGLEGNSRDAYKLLSELRQNAMADNDLKFLSLEIELYRLFIGLKLLQDKHEVCSDIDMLGKSNYYGSLVSLVQAKYFMECGQNDRAIDLLLPLAGAESQIALANYFLGKAKLYKGDRDAYVYLIYFMKQRKGQRLKKDAQLGIFWHCLINGELKRAESWRHIIKASSGSRREHDKAAEKMVMDSYNPLLLEARLRFDGSYYSNSLAVLQRIDSSMIEQADLVELAYRKGRCLEKLGRLKEAKKAFIQCINLTYNPSQYYIPVSYYRLGLLALEDNNRSEAIGHFQQCQSYKGYPYQRTYNAWCDARVREIKKP